MQGFRDGRSSKPWILFCVVRPRDIGRLKTRKSRAINGPEQILKLDAHKKPGQMIIICEIAR